MSPLREPEASPDPFAKLYNIEAEQQLLGILFYNNAAWEYVCDLMRAEDFSHAAHTRLYQIIGERIGQGLPVDPINCKAIVEADPVLKQAGGFGYLMRIVDAVVSVINAPHYAQTVADLARRREIVVAAQEILDDAARLEPTRSGLEVIDSAEQRLREIADAAAKGGPEAVGMTAQHSIQQTETAYQAGGVGLINTGLIDLDRIVNGLSPGDLIVLGGRPSMGKSALGGSIALNVAKAGGVGLFFSLEMTKIELSRRWLAGLSLINTDRQRHGKLDQPDWVKLIEAQRYLAALPIYVDDQSRLSVAQMRQRARRLKRRHGLSLIIVDHLQLIRQGGRIENRRLEIGDATSSLKALAKELGVPILLLSQIGRVVESREEKRPTMSDLKESGDIEQDADVILFLYREEYYLERSRPRRREGQSDEAYGSRLTDYESLLVEARGRAEVSVAKNRHGKTGMVEVSWNGERQHFGNLGAL